MWNYAVNTAEVPFNALNVGPGDFQVNWNPHKPHLDKWPPYYWMDTVDRDPMTGEGVETPFIPMEPLPDEVLEYY